MPTYVASFCQVNWSTEATKTILRVLGELLKPGVIVCTWERPEPRMIHGKLVHYLGWPEYHPLIDEVFALCFAASDPCDPYLALPEDPPGTEPRDVIKYPQDMDNATLAQVQRWFLLTKRAERFYDGYIEAQFESGMMRTAARRLASLTGIAHADHPDA